jgi:hypothetical protein
MRQVIASIMGALGVGLLALPAAAQAPPGPVRGAVQSLDGNRLTVAGASGPAVVVLADDWKVTVLKKIDVGAIKPGSFIGTTNVDKPDGTGQSTEVHVFPPGLRAGEGHYPMPGQTAMMTNGDVTTVVTDAKGQELDIKYNGRGGSGVRHVVVPPGTPVVLFTDGDRSVIKPGAQVLVFAAPGADGALHGGGVLTGEGGAAPPF